MKRVGPGLLAVAALAAGCTMGRNYPPDGPRFAGAPVRAAAGRDLAGSLRVVSFNIEFALRVDSAIAVLTSDSALAGADVVLLQEMDGESAARVARALGMWYVYYPAVRHSRTGRDFGNAVLSRFPIAGDAKIVLPHRGRLGRTVRTATAVTIEVGPERVRVYSVHLGTIADVGPGARAAQLRAVLADARPWRRVIIGGDFNSHGVARVAQAEGYDWATEHGPRTASAGRWDHILFKGFRVPEGAAGVALSRRARVSDHWPVWAVAFMAGEPAAVSER